MPDQNIGNIGWKKHWIFFASEDLGEYKGRSSGQ
jgi:hypothetical protein